MQRESIFITGNIGYTGALLEGQTEADVVRPGAGQAITGQGGYDYVRLDLFQYIIGQAEVFHYTGREIVYYDIAYLDQLLEQLYTTRVGEVQGEAVFIGVD